MIELLSIFGDVMRIATFQWHDGPHAGRCKERQAGTARWSPLADRYPVRRLRP